MQERRLLQLHAQCLLQRIVEYGVAGGVVKVGKNDGFLSGAGVRLAQTHEQGGGEQNYNCKAGCANLPVTARTRRWSRSAGWRRFRSNSNRRTADPSHTTGCQAVAKTG